MKVCSCCKEAKPLDSFGKDKKQKDGLCLTCKECRKEQCKVSYLKRKNKISEYVKQKRKEQPEVFNKRRQKFFDENPTYLKDWQEANRERLNAKNREWKQANKAKVNASTRNRQARQLQATPPWFSKEDVQYYYNLAEYFTWLSGGFVKYHVDHVVPLRGKNVCGLHVQNNLQVINSVANLRKSNKHASNI